MADFTYLLALACALVLSAVDAAFFGSSPIRYHTGISPPELWLPPVSSVHTLESPLYPERYDSISHMPALHAPMHTSATEGLLMPMSALELIRANKYSVWKMVRWPKDAEFEVSPLFSYWDKTSYGWGYSSMQEHPIAGMTCHGGWCSKKSLIAYPMGSNPTLTPVNYWTYWISSDGPTEAFCPFRSFVSQVQCKGDYCERMRFGCSYLLWPFGTGMTRLSLSWTEWFSEEQTVEYCRNGSYVVGMTCSGERCDNIKMACAPVYKQRNFEVAS